MENRQRNQKADTLAAFLTFDCKGGKKSSFAFTKTQEQDNNMHLTFCLDFLKHFLISKLVANGCLLLLNFAEGLTFTNTALYCLVHKGRHEG